MKKLLSSSNKTTRDAQCIYDKLTKHATGFTAAQLAADTLLKYITCALYHFDWFGTSYAIFLHWREQISRYEKLELENVPTKQTLRMLQNGVSDGTNLSHVMQLRDQGVTCGGPNLCFENIWNSCCLYIPLTIKITSHLDLASSMYILQL
jgi:hypothetical protein